MGISREDMRFLTIKTIQNGILMDEIVGINLSQVAAPAPLFLAFWNTLPASTPAQVLRRWDGAHTGPVGSRHGLRYLIESIDEFHLPVTYA